MRIRLIAAGTRLPAWIDAGVEEYARRFGRGLKFELVEIPLAREAERMRAAIGASRLRRRARSRRPRDDDARRSPSGSRRAWPAARTWRSSSADPTASMPACRRAPISAGRSRR